MSQEAANRVTALMPHHQVCNCDHSKVLADVMRRTGRAFEEGLVTLLSPGITHEQERVVIARLVSLAQSMKECP